MKTKLLIGAAGSLVVCAIVIWAAIILTKLGVSVQVRVMACALLSMLLTQAVVSIAIHLSRP